MGDAAYRKTTSRELQNQRIIRALEIEGLGSTLCTIVDFKGERFICQSVIPGILAQGEGIPRLMYGVLEREKNITVSF